MNSRAPQRWSLSGWRTAGLGRRDYFICLALVAILAFALSSLQILASASFLMFMGRTRNIRREQLWSWPGFAIVGLELFLRPLARWASAYVERPALGYAVIGLIAIHLVFAIALGLQRPKQARPPPAPLPRA